MVSTDVVRVEAGLRCSARMRSQSASAASRLSKPWRRYWTLLPFVLTPTDQRHFRPRLRPYASTPRRCLRTLGGDALDERAVAVLVGVVEVLEPGAGVEPATY
jgi:hypothetical protein